MGNNWKGGRRTGGKFLDDRQKASPGVGEEEAV